MSNGSIIPAYATPLWHSKASDSAVMNEGLKELILERADPEPSDERSNMGGWHSGIDLLQWGGPYIDQLIKTIQGGIQSLTKATGGAEDAQQGMFYTIAWANVLYQGGYNRVHDHFGYIWSGVYYVDVGDPTPDRSLSGVLEFVDPRAAVTWPYVPGEPFRQPIRVNPEAGMMVMFPSWLLHHVHPYMGARPRISIAFNAAFKFDEERDEGGGPPQY